MVPKQKRSDESSMPRTFSPTKGEWASVSLALTLAAGIHVIYLLEYKAIVPYYSFLITDSAYYDGWASNIAHGVCYGATPFYMPPLYPYAVSVIYRLLGHQVLFVYIWQLCLGLFSVFLTYLIGRRLFGHRSGILAIVLLIAYTPLMWLETKILTEPLAIALNLTSLLLLMQALDKNRISAYLFAGVAFGLSAICRPVALITVVLVIVWLSIGRRSLALRARTVGVLALATGVGLAVFPVTARNYFVGKDRVLISANGGIVFAQCNNTLSRGLHGNYPGFTGVISTQQEEELRIAQEAEGRPLKPSESSAYWFRVGLSYAREHPKDFVVLIGRKLMWSLHNFEPPCNYNLYVERSMVPLVRYLSLPFTFLASLAVFGFVLSLARKSEASSVLVFYTLSVVLSLLIFTVSSRYRAPIAPALAVFAGYGATQLAAWRDPRRMIKVAVCMLPILLLLAVPPPVPGITAQGLCNLGVSYLKAGRVDESIVQFKRSLVINPGNSVAHIGLGNALTRKGKLDEAIVHYNSAIRLKPDYANIHLRPGMAMYAKGNIAEAVDHPHGAIRLSPDLVEARLNLSAALLRLGRIEEAIAQCRYLIQLVPDLAEAHNNLAVALYDKGDYLAAWAEVNWCIAHDLGPNPDFIRSLSEKMPDPGRG